MSRTISTRFAAGKFPYAAWVSLATSEACSCNRTVSPLFRKLSLECASLGDRQNLARRAANMVGTSAALPQSSALSLGASLKCRRVALWVHSLTSAISSNK